MMETKRLAERIPKGTFARDRNHVCGNNGKGAIIASFNIPITDYEANAELFSEAMNVTNQCGYTPKELLEQRNEAINILRDYVHHMDNSEKSAIEFLKKYQP